MITDKQIYQEYLTYQKVAKKYWTKDTEKILKASRAYHFFSLSIRFKEFKSALRKELSRLPLIGRFYK